MPTDSAGDHGDPGQHDRNIINAALSACRAAVISKIAATLESKRSELNAYQPLYHLLSDYPFRAGKMLRPAMCISAARACGGLGQSAVTAAAALELYHNAFLIHDDIEDGSESRRGHNTLHREVGVARAINAGDATNVLAVGLLLENLAVVGVAKALQVLHEIEFMARQSTEGQATELDWVAANVAQLDDQDYFVMCAKKTCWYSFITPLRVGCIVGRHSTAEPGLSDILERITRFGLALGIAFQVQDDLLNLRGEHAAYGKEIGGDLYEGKRTLMLNHTLKTSSRADYILGVLGQPRERKRPEDVALIRDEMERCGSIKHGWSVAREHAGYAAGLLKELDFLAEKTLLQSDENWNCEYLDRRFLHELVNYVIYRNL